LIECLLAPALGELRPLIVAPHGESGQWWEPDDTALVLGLARAARRRWPQASPRTVIMGYSNGGIGAWYFARLYPQHFTAAIPIASNHTIVGETPLPVYAIHGTRDELFPVGPLRSAVEALRQQGGNVALNEKYRGTHLAPCSYREQLSGAAAWLRRLRQP
jgi:predicted esterase